MLLVGRYKPTEDRERPTCFLEIGWGGRIRTCAWRHQKPLPYHLATPQHLLLRWSAKGLISNLPPWGKSQLQLISDHCSEQTFHPAMLVFDKTALNIH